MSISEMIKKDEVRNKELNSRRIANGEARLKSLYAYKKLAKDESFVTWYKEHVLEAAKANERAHLSVVDTNLSFILKGKAQTYASQQGWLGKVQSEINAIEKSLYAVNEQDSYQPEN